MIPKASLIAWSSRAPWPSEDQIEQDLILSRLLVEIANDQLLSNELAFRGGTCLHKLHFEEPLRYSEDLDFVRTNQRPMLGKIFDALRSIADRVGLREHRWRFPYAVDSSWWSGDAKVRTFPIEEILATKVRALCQRRKGRDLFDLWIGLDRPGVDGEEIAAGLYHYMGSRVYSYPQLVNHFETKLDDPDFAADLVALVRSIPAAYDIPAALDLVRQRIGLHLRNVPEKPASIMGSC